MHVPELFLDQTGLLSTVPVKGSATVRSLPRAGGLAPARVWRIPVGRSLPSHVAELLAEQREQTPRGLALTALVAVGVELAGGPVAPRPGPLGPTGECQWAWLATPDAALARRRDEAVAGALAVGAVLGEQPSQTVADFLDRLVSAIIPARSARALLAALGGAPSRGSQRSRALQWAAQVAARRAADARVAISLAPPADADPAAVWTATPMALRLSEPTTRIPLASAAPEEFGAGRAAWQVFQDVERTSLISAWGGSLPTALAALAQGNPAPLNTAEVLELIDRVAPKLIQRGFDVVAPDGLLRRAQVKRTLRATSGGSGELAAQHLGLAPEVLVDGQILTAEQFRELAAAKSELVSIRGRWVRIDPTQAARIAALAARLKRRVTISDLLTDEAFSGVELTDEALLPHGLAAPRQVPSPPGVRAILRPYQLAGLSWLTWLADNRIGGILADDMGLGKTLQVLAAIAADIPGPAGTARPGPTLVVCPVTLVDTWVRQAAQFTPELVVQAHHGSGRGGVDAAIGAADIVVTTYGILARDEQLLAVGWRRVVLDEAQAIKNPDTRAARAARALRAEVRIAVTGTPVENHVGDLWSLLAFAQPGLLPRRKQFDKRFIGGTPADLQLLRQVVSPFLLRRVKTDPGILPDLPDREVVRDDCTMTREQIGTYEAVVADMMGTLAELRGKPAAEPGMGRRATVLGSISRLKQICVHPALLTENRAGLHHRSGKVERLVELCSQIVAEGQAVVVFTQFASFVPDLAAHLAAELGVGVATLTGSDSRAQRAAAVRQFSATDGPPILIASLKAGGTGLTLVRANNVIHLDRWWNPAVEDQASDRVWRIGQHQKVTVHVLVCPGTLEDQIDQALAGKRAVAGSVVRSTDRAITELSDADLGALVQLVRDRILT